MELALDLYPEYVTYFSLSRHQLPRKNERMKKTNNVLDDLVIIDDDGFHADEVNLIIRGKSFDLERSNIRENVYFLNGTMSKNIQNTTTNFVLVLHYSPFRVEFLLWSSTRTYHLGSH